jgi:hypothetical protein
MQQSPAWEAKMWLDIQEVSYILLTPSFLDKFIIGHIVPILS